MQRRQLQRQRDAQAQRRHVHVLERRRRLRGVASSRSATVAMVQRQRAARHCGTDLDRAAAFRVPCDVGDEMAHRLGDALGVAAQPRQPVQAGCELERHVVRLQRRRQRALEPLQCVGEVERRVLQRRVVVGQARELRQLVGDAHEVAQLAFHDGARAPAAFRIVVGQPQQLDGVGQRRQRIAQVVRQPGQERVALAVRQLGGVGRRVALAAHGRERRLGIGQRGLHALQFIVGRGHPLRLLAGLGDGHDVALALVAQFGDVRRGGAQPRREHGDEGRKGRAEQDEHRNDGLSNGTASPSTKAMLRRRATREPRL